MKPTDAARLLDISTSAIRSWTLYDFREYFSTDAQGGDGRARNISEVDLKVLHLIASSKRENISTEQIHMDLQAARKNNYENLPLPLVAPRSASVPVMPLAAADVQARGLLREITELQRLIDTLQARLDSKDETIIDLSSRLAAAERELELWRAGRLKPE